MAYIIRLDDACEKRDIEKWDRMEKLLDKYSIKPLVGIIPHCEDPSMDKFQIDASFWKRVECWEQKKWAIALHGFSHVCTTNQGGINPVNNRSEFAGLDLETQKDKISRGIEIFRSHGIDPKVFFAPSHTFDENTLAALKECSNIRIVSDTVANKPYSKYGMTFVPQQSGMVRKLPFHTVTFCYHPNTMKEKDFDHLERFLKEYKDQFIIFPIEEVRRKASVIDRLLKKAYFMRR